MRENQLKAWMAAFWPFNAFEMKKLGPLLLMKFLVSSCYCILTALKDTMVVTSQGGGAEVIPVLKGWVVFPFSILIALVYSRLSNRLKPTTLFYSVLFFFAGVCFLLGFVLYPHAEWFAPDKSAIWLENLFGESHAHWIAVYRNWIPSMLFVTAELWGGVVIMLLFWGFANQVSTLREAARCYSIYIAAGDLGSILIGAYSAKLAMSMSGMPHYYTARIMLGWIVVLSLLVAALYFYLQRYVLTDPRHLPAPEEMAPPKKKKIKEPLLTSLKRLATSPHLFGIAMIVIGYGLTINLIEVSWKASLKELCPRASDYQFATSQATFWVGFVSLVLSIGIGKKTLERLSWKGAANLSPLVVGGSGLLFLVLLAAREPLAIFFQDQGRLLSFIVFLGAFQNVMSKAVKYSFFDPTKEMAFIPLDPEVKVKGKAAVDVVGARLGKSGSSWIQIALIDLVGHGSILSVTNFIIPIVAMAVIGWLYSVSHLDRHLKDLTQKRTKAFSAV